MMQGYNEMPAVDLLTTAVDNGTSVVLSFDVSCLLSDALDLTENHPPMQTCICQIGMQRMCSLEKQVGYNIFSQTCLECKLHLSILCNCCKRKVSLFICRRKYTEIYS